MSFVSRQNRWNYSLDRGQAPYGYFSFRTLILRGCNYADVSASDDSSRSTAISAGIGVGMGMGAGWGIVMAQILGGELMIGIPIGAGAGILIALVSGAVVYDIATTE